MVKGFISSLAALAVVTTVTFVPATAASPTEFKGTFAKPVKMSQLELSQAHATSVPAIADTGIAMGIVSPDVQSPNWSYTGLWPDSYIDTMDTYNVSTSGQSVTIKLCQYPNGVLYGEKVAKASYQLLAISGGVSTTAYSVEGNYDSTNYTFSFHNVSKGTFKLRIRNLTKTSTSQGFDINGNGFVFYY